MENAKEDHGPVLGKDILPFQSAKALYELYHSYELRYRKWLQSNKKTLGAVHHRMMSPQEFGAWIVCATAEEMHERLHMWSMTGKQYLQWKIKEAI